MLYCIHLQLGLSYCRFRTIFMDVKARYGATPETTLPEQQPVEYWWEPGSSSSGLSHLLYINASEELTIV